jgi:adenosylhomocysteine nucleosidase
MRNTQNHPILTQLQRMVKRAVMNTMVLISADVEWRAVLSLLGPEREETSPVGEWFTFPLEATAEPVIFFHGGWGKISAAASTQYVIDRWSPHLLFNLGTCGGFLGEVERGEILLVERTLVYDIVEQMGDPEAHLAHYSSRLDVSWLPEPPKLPHPVRCALLISGDRDIVAEEIPELKQRYGAIAADWESGAIAWVAARNQTRLVILRGVTDLVSSEGGEAYLGNMQLFVENTQEIMGRLLSALPQWIRLASYYVNT